MAEADSKGQTPPPDPPQLARAIGVLRRMFTDSCRAEAAGIEYRLTLAMQAGQIEARSEEYVPAAVFGRILEPARS